MTRDDQVARARYGPTVGHPAPVVEPEDGGASIRVRAARESDREDLTLPGEFMEIGKVVIGLD